MTRVAHPSPRSAVPSLRVEKRLLGGGRLRVAGCDEVGRGALCGPVTVGAVLVDATVRRPLPGLRDSKLLTPAARERLVPRIQRWCVGHAVGHASPAEIDEWGLMTALRLAGWRALAALPARPDIVLLDGNVDYLGDRTARRAGANAVWPDDESPPPGVDQVALFDPEPFAALEPAPEGSRRPADLDVFAPWAPPPPVVTMIKADLRCSSVAAASVLAKTTRDAIMVELSGEFPAFGWHENKGYAAPVHLEALSRFGPSPQHRQSWNLPRQPSLEWVDEDVGENGESRPWGAARGEEVTA